MPKYVIVFDASSLHYHIALPDPVVEKQYNIVPNIGPYSESATAFLMMRMLNENRSE